MYRICIERVFGREKEAEKCCEKYSDYGATVERGKSGNYLAVLLKKKDRKDLDGPLDMYGRLNLDVFVQIDRD